MKAFITATDEPTTNLCGWALRRNGFDVYIFEGNMPLADKLDAIYQATDEDFVRVDADVIVNSNFLPEALGARPEIWWWQFLTFDWYKQDTTTGGINFVRKEALPALRAHQGEFRRSLRPETALSRIDELHDPRRFDTWYLDIMGLHGFAQDDLDRVIRIKSERGQLANYDFDLVQRLNEFVL